ncbi:MAG: hypothetical protein DRJ07_00885 [Bacteroidetes bacterium]|nr:MAG: hypothetical protein DRJ07_00885 [Bacteroidota bacterium]
MHTTKIRVYDVNQGLKNTNNQHFNIQYHQFLWRSYDSNSLFSAKVLKPNKAVQNSYPEDYLSQIRHLYPINSTMQLLFKITLYFRKMFNTNFWKLFVDVRQIKNDSVDI